MSLSNGHIQWLSERRISVEAATRLGVHSGTSEGGKVVPDDRGNVLVFPYVDRGQVVAEKYRGPAKKFWQREGGKKTFYNADILDDPSLQNGRDALVICEGEMDCLAVISAGYPFAVSVPDGAPPVPDGSEPEDLTDTALLGDGDMATGKFAFLWNNRERLRKIRRFIVAGDADGPGRRLTAVLVRYLGAARCSRIEYPEGCKDANDVLMKLGESALMTRIVEAKDCPVRGIYDLTDFQDEETKLYPIGIDGWAPRLKLFDGAFVVVTGPTNHGKTSFAMEIAANMARDHDWRIAVFSPEQRPVEIRNLIRTLHTGGEWTFSLVERADAWMRKHFKLILGDPIAVGERDEEVTLQWVLDRAEDAVLRHDINMLVIDPWNELEHARKPGESVTDYTGRAIREIKRFARQYGVLVMICVHPTKDFTRTGGKARSVTLYDCEGSAHWANKADIGLVVERAEEIPNGATVTIAKLRYKKYGLCGAYPMQFDSKSQRFRDRL